MTEEEQQEYAAELLRMAERYKADEARRRVSMLQAAQLTGQPAGNAYADPTTPRSGPDLDEYAYLGTTSPPVQGDYKAAGGPTMTRQPLKIPLDREFTHADIPPGYALMDNGTIKDPDGNPARFTFPSRREAAGHVIGGLTPAAGAVAFPLLARIGQAENFVGQKLDPAEAAAGLKALREQYEEDRRKLR